jgi:hypothetical protein
MNIKYSAEVLDRLARTPQAEWREHDTGDVSGFMTQFALLLQRFTYKPGYTFDLVGHGALRCRYHAIDSTDPARKREIYLTTTHALFPAHLYFRPGDIEEVFMEQMRQVCMEIERHEMDEWLQLDGKAPFYPHK